MKPFTSFKVLTLASLIVYSGSSFAQKAAAPAQAADAPTSNAQSQAIIEAKHFSACVLSVNAKINQAGGGAAAMIPSNLTLDQISFSASYVAEAQKVYPSAMTDLASCSNPGTANKTDESCSKLETEIDSAATDLKKDCAHPPKVSSDTADGLTIATADTAKETHSTWGLCLQDAVSCQKAEYGDNDSADKCADSSLDDLQKSGANPDELKTFCQNNYPAQCGALNRSNLKTTAKDLDGDLTAEMKELTRDLAEKKKDLQDNKDKLDAADKQQQGFAAKALQDTKDLQTQYEAQVKASGSQIDSALENSYKLIAVSQQAVKTAAANVTQADAVKFDAQNKFANACKAQAKAEANKELPTGAVNYGGQNALVTRNAKWQEVYNATLQSLYADGTTCDGGSYANATLALLNSQKAQVQAEADVQKAQSDLQLAMQKNTMKKDDASLDLLNKQRDKVSQLAAKQKQDYQDITTKEATLRKNAATMQDEINKIQAKIDNVPKKRACIQTIRSCSTVAGVPSGGSSSAISDIEDAPNALSKLIGLCKQAGKVCTDPATKSLPTHDVSIQFFNTTLENQVQSPKDPNLVFDTNKADCAEAIASQIEENGPKELSSSKKKSTQKKASDQHN